MQTPMKQGDTLQAIARQITFNNQPFDYTDPEWRLLWSAKDAGSGAVQFLRRDFTAYTRANGTPDQGVVAMPTFTGATLPGARSAAVTVPGGGGGALVSFPAGPAGTLTQRIYATKANTPAGPLFFIAEVLDGTGAGGIVVAVPDAALIAPAPADDESATNGNLTGLGTPATPVAVADASVGMTPGDHEFAIVNVGPCDNATTILRLFEVITVNAIELRERTWPESGFEEWITTPDVA